MTSDSEQSSSNAAKNSADDDKENETVTLQEILDSEKECEEAVTAVLGASDEVNCSYDTGYVFRQALYCCKTCINAAKAADPTVDETSLYHGVCLACSFECHADHELYELYTKRNFRCDCGNSKFSKSGAVCKLKPEKDDLNAENVYNHNFVGLYCTCNLPYPELDTTDETPTQASPSKVAVSDATANDDMIQCTICEDWFHMSHLLCSDAFRTDDDPSTIEDMICHLCMSANRFLWNYSGYLSIKVKEDIQSEEKGEADNDQTKVDVEKDSPTKELCQAVASGECLLVKQQSAKRDALFADEKMREKQDAGEICAFFLNNWREALCKCESCLAMYKEKRVEFLIRENDTIKYYEECGKLKAKENENKQLMKELSTLNRTSQVEFLHNLNDFKNDFTDFLLEFGRNGKVIKRENVDEFFEGQREKQKKRKVETDNQMASNYYCK